MMTATQTIEENEAREAERLDAARYRALVAAMLVPNNTAFMNAALAVNDEPKTKAEFDACIDAAIKAMQ